jgi:hypothetical protein
MAMEVILGEPPIGYLDAVVRPVAVIPGATRPRGTLREVKRR